MLLTSKCIQQACEKNDIKIHYLDAIQVAHDLNNSIDFQNMLHEIIIAAVVNQHENVRK